MRTRVVIECITLKKFFYIEKDQKHLGYDKEMEKNLRACLHEFAL